MSDSTLHYSMVIQWSEDDQVYVVSLPEWGDLVHTHGDSYEAALEAGRTLLDALIKSRRDRSEPLPAPRVFA
ncbi:MAG: type II toxin-antitoxin system HicB family antitoxin [Chloroflexota bacterium]|nr:type II toxin-antitoxin system HicB family antitoxin [Chloroflexota bacterium]